MSLEYLVVVELNEVIKIHTLTHITLRLNNTLLNNQEITEEIKEEIIKYLETNDNKCTTMQNLWDAAKALLRGKFIAIQAYIKKQETSRINNLAPKAIRERRAKNPQS